MCYKDIREKVKRIKNQYESCNPLTIIKELNIVPAFFAQDIADELPDGCYFKSQGIAFILIDSTLNEHERNITYAHEIAKSEYVSVELVRYKYNSLYKSNFTFKNYA